MLGALHERPRWLARLERDAKLLASLNHPDIAQVFGFNANAIARELVEGQTLDEGSRQPQLLWRAGPER